MVYLLCREMAYKVERTSYSKGIVGSSSWCVPAGSENLRLVFCFIKIRLIFLFWGAKFYDMHATAYSLQFIISFLVRLKIFESGQSMIKGGGEYW